MAEKGPKKFSRFMRHGTRGDQVEKRRPGKKWQKKGRKNFRALCAMVSEVTRYKKGGQVEKRRPGIKMAEKGPKKFSRFMRHFPTTYYS